MRKLTHQEIVARQKVRVHEGRLPFTVVLNDIRSLHNVGSIFRTADAVGVEKIWLCGITGAPPHPQIAKTALGAETQVAWEYRKDILPLLADLKRQGYTIVVLEQIEGSIPFQEFKTKTPTCLIVGNEITGTSMEILNLCDAAIEIEMSGIKNSLNVAVAFGVVAYHLRYQLS